MKKLVLLVFYLLVIVSCNKTNQQIISRSNFKDPHKISEDALKVDITGQYGGRIISATITDPKTFNQLLFYEDDSQTYNELTGAGLIRLNLKTQEPEPAIAKSWENSADKLNWTFHLRKGLQWSDGAPFTAADVIFTMQIVNDPKIPSAPQDALTVNGEKIQWIQKDDYTIIAKLPTVFAPFLRQLDGATLPIVAKHKWQKVYQQGQFQQAMQASMDAKDYVCMGPFKLQQYKAGQRVTFVRNPYYWKIDRNGNRLPYVDEVTFVIFSNLDQVQLKIENGEIDTFQGIRPEDFERLDQHAASIKTKIYNVGPAYDTEQLIFNQNGDRNPKTGKLYLNPVKRSWFSDANFRQAVSYALNRRTLVQNALYGRGVVAYGPESISNILWYSDRIVRYPYDPVKALELLKRSGFTEKIDPAAGSALYDKRGNKVIFSLNTNAGNTIRNTECILIASDLARIGIQVEYKPLDFNSLIDKMTTSFDFDAVLLGLSHDDIDPSGGMNVWPSSGSLHFWWPEQKRPATEWEERIDELMNLQSRTFDRNLRKKYYDEVQQILADQQPVIFTVTQYIYVTAKEDLMNLKPAVARHRTLWNADELYWKNLN